MTRFQFRAWDKIHKRMITTQNISSGRDIFLISPDGQVFGQGYIILACFEIMQLTGLKDTKGIDIYEGDIILDPYGGRNLPVIWNSFNTCFSINHNHAERTQVLGNIYENPELLNVASSRS